MSSTKEIKWGILATGGIAKTFAKDLTVDPKTRNVTHIRHRIVAAASSSSASRAKDFLQEVGAPNDAKAYGSYQELVNDANIDIIYIATPHSHHYQNAMLCLNAGKNVLCEKAFTTNAAQTKKLIETAKAKNLFLMEAVWTRYFPLSIYVRKLITDGTLGTVYRVMADLSLADDPESSYPEGKHRMVNPELAGGCLLDLGIYSLTWCFQTLFTTQPGASAAKQPPTVQASVKQYKTGVDEQSSILLTFPRPQDQGGDAHAIATTSLRVATNPGNKSIGGPAIRIQGTKGEVQVMHPAFRPTKTRHIDGNGTVEDKDWPQPGPGAGSGWYNGFGSNSNAEGEGHGMFWEADEAATAVVEGRKEGKYLDLTESLVIMNVMDQVRQAGAIKYPTKVESLDFPLEL